MNPPCGRCNKIVYPTEKVNCLDKYWHKGCFNCEVCKTTLNMKTYKGFDKKPYCSAHYPKTTFTAVPDTPENLRLKEATKNQSQVAYKEDFVKNKGRGFSTVNETPELQRLKKIQDQVSNVRYHEEYEKKQVGSKRQPHPTSPANAPSAAFQPPAASQNYHYDPTPEPVRQAAAAPPPSTGKRYRAVYDYSAADEDEVSFMDGDVIVDVQQIDEGWMYGRVERTGQQGMLPANYVEAI
ncbi:LIM and SH3 domain protein 1 [Thalassophryne amazonica]|uniref:LIM and SH3 domain protein 1 n=1 Tax=Thalassophryne amazonica TaxID=390379 RepID=UPI001470C72B|nr:LIM and SH3 domain protein 1 [Thalassophryne amazonica]